jgi:uncharacterized protein
VKIEGPGKRVCIHVGEGDQWHGQALFNAIVERARQEGLAGATVTRGIEGFGVHSRIHTASILRLSEALPIKIEIIDTAERVAGFLPVLDEMVTEGLVTVEDCEIVKYVRSDEGGG